MLKQQIWQQYFYEIGVVRYFKIESDAFVNFGIAPDCTFKNIFLTFGNRESETYFFLMGNFGMIGLD